MTAKSPILGIFGGTALVHLPFPVIDEFEIETPFGQPSDTIKQVQLDNGYFAFILNRHGAGHVYSPSSINYRANVWAMKHCGVTHLLSISAVGSLQEHIVPGETLVIPTQLFDFTRGLRPRTFFQGDNDVVAHVSLADPFCPAFHACLIRLLSTSRNPTALQANGTYVVIEGPNYSTRAESLFFKNSLQAYVVGMTAMPEARLAREAQLCYAVICLPADYDSWRMDEKGVDADEVVAGLEPFKPLIAPIITGLAKVIVSDQCGCGRALSGFAIHSDLKAVPEYQLEKYQLLLA